MTEIAQIITALFAALTFVGVWLCKEFNNKVAKAVGQHVKLAERITNERLVIAEFMSEAVQVTALLMAELNGGELRPQLRIALNRFNELSEQINQEGPAE